MSVQSKVISPSQILIQEYAQRITQLNGGQGKSKLLNELAEELIGKEPDESIRYANRVIDIGTQQRLRKEVARAYNTKGTAYWHKNEYREAIDAHENALNIWELVHDKKGVIKSLTGIGNTHIRKGNFREALDYFQRALKEFGGVDYPEGIAGLYNNIGIIYKNWGDYEKAVLYYQRSLDIKEEKGLTGGIAYSYNNLGILHFLQDNFEKALEYYQKAEQLYIEDDNKNLLADTYNNIGIIYSKKGQYEDALKYLMQSLKIKEELGDRSGMTVSYREIGEINKQQGYYDISFENYFKALAIHEEINSRSGVGFFCNRIGEILLLTDRSVEAEKYLIRALAINLETGSKSYYKDSYLFLSKALAAQGKHEKAYHYQSLFIDVKDELFNEERTKTISEIQTKYEAQKKDLEIEKLNLQQEYLISINRELELFAGKAAHDLKEPLRMINSYSGLLSNRHRELLDEDGKEYLDIVLNASHRMGSLLSGLLEYARSGADNVKKEKIDLNEILTHVTYNLKLVIEETGTIIKNDPLPTIEAAPSNMMQLFQNLISNAIKFQKKDEKPIVKIHCQKKSDHYQIAVEDNGIGIPDEHQANVFEIFRRLNSRRHYEGSGIGLATCKKIIEGLKGNIWVESTHKVGTTFYFTIPFPKKST